MLRVEPQIPQVPHRLHHPPHVSSVSLHEVAAKLQSLGFISAGMGKGAYLCGELGRTATIVVRHIRKCGYALSKNEGPYC